MPIAVRITPSKMTRDDYERVMRQLEETGSGEPDGRVFHASYGEDEVHMFDVWDSHGRSSPTTTTSWRCCRERASTAASCRSSRSTTPSAATRDANDEPDGALLPQ
jgi:hypothetical protein